MFKATFPWAAADEEQAERGYIRELSTTASDEVAGNVWITESAGMAMHLPFPTVANLGIALKLAEDYGILPWIVALLDTSSIQADDKKAISSPPMYKFKANEKTFLPPALATPARSRGRPRASSPSKKDKPTSPRKPRISKAVKEANAANARQASENLQATLDAASVAESETPELPSVNGEKSPSPVTKKASKSKAKDAKVEDADESEKVTVNVQSTTEVDGDQETIQTTVSVKMPLGSPDLPLPEDTAEMIAKAKQMVEEARKLEGESSSSNTKRKADVFDDEEEDVENEVDGMELQPAKKTKLMELEVKKQKVRNRALLGVAASLAIGYVVGYVSSYIG